MEGVDHFHSYYLDLYMYIEVSTVCEEQMIAFTHPYYLEACTKLMIPYLNILEHNKKMSLNSSVASTSISPYVML